METKHVYDDYEISGCRRYNEDEKDDRQYVEPCDDAEARFWTLYGHIDGRGVEAIGDFHSRRAAEEVFYRITGQPFTGSYQAGARLCLMHAAPKLLAALEGVLYALDENLDGPGPSKPAAIANARDAVALATAARPPWVSADPDIHALLADRREIAVVWCVEDVQSVRPDLTDDQAWGVLQQVEDVHDAEWGISWTTLEDVAGDLFPKRKRTKEK
jgi:hypothetical protein